MFGIFQMKVVMLMINTMQEHVEKSPLRRKRVGILNIHASCFTFDHFDKCMAEVKPIGTCLMTKLTLWEPLNHLLHRDHVLIPMYHSITNHYSLLDCYQGRKWFRHINSVSSSKGGDFFGGSYVYRAGHMV